MISINIFYGDDMQLSIDLLRTFVVVVNTMSFTRAGLIVNRTQSAVSMQMKRLEEEIGRPLFEKNGKGFRLTSTGEMLVEHARRVLKTHDEAVMAISKPEMTGRVRFGSAVDYASSFLSDVLARFSMSHPTIRVDMDCGSPDKIYQGVKQGELDLAIFTEIGEGELVRREPVVWLTSNAHLIHEEDPLPLAVYHEGCHFRRWATERLTEMGRSYRIAYVSHSISGILAAVEAGLAVSPVGGYNYRPGFRVLGSQDGFPLLPSAAITLLKAEGPRSGAVECFAGYVMEIFLELGIENPRTGGCPVAGV